MKSSSPSISTSEQEKLLLSLGFTKVTPKGNLKGMTRLPDDISEALELVIQLEEEQKAQEKQKAEEKKKAETIKKLLEYLQPLANTTPIPNTDLAPPTFVAQPDDNESSSDSDSDLAESEHQIDQYTYLENKKSLPSENFNMSGIKGIVDRVMEMSEIRTDIHIELLIDFGSKFRLCRDELQSQLLALIENEFKISIPNEREEGKDFDEFFKKCQTHKMLFPFFQFSLRYLRACFFLIRNQDSSGLACFLLGFLSFHNLIPGKSESLVYFQKSQKLSFPLAPFGLAMISDIKNDDKTTFEYLTQIEKLSFPRAIFFLYMLEKKKGHYSAATQYLLRAGELDDPNACYALAAFYSTGKANLGIQPDEKLAQQYSERSKRLRPYYNQCQVEAKEMKEKVLKKQDELQKDTPSPDKKEKTKKKTANKKQKKLRQAAEAAAAAAAAAAEAEAAKAEENASTVANLVRMLSRSSPSSEGSNFPRIEKGEVKVPQLPTEQKNASLDFFEVEKAYLKIYSIPEEEQTKNAFQLLTRGFLSGKGIIFFELLNEKGLFEKWFPSSNPKSIEIFRSQLAKFDSEYSETKTGVKSRNVDDVDRICALLIAKELKNFKIKKNKKLKFFHHQIVHPSTEKEVQEIAKKYNIPENVISNPEFIYDKVYWRWHKIQMTEGLNSKRMTV